MRTAPVSDAALVLHYHPVSTSSRPVMMLAAEHGLPLDCRVVNLWAEQQLSPAFAALNPACAVPVLQHGSFTLAEHSAILKYLAEHHGLDSAYPRAPQARARLNALMDWLNTTLSREYCHGFVNPQIMARLQRPEPAFQAAQLAWARPRARAALGLLDEHLIGPRRALLGAPEGADEATDPTLPDLMAVAMLTLGEALGEDYAHWRNIRRFLAHMKARPAFASTHTLFYQVMMGMFVTQPCQRL